MVLELRVPVGDNIKDLAPVVPVLMGYILSFVYVGMYWNNHHHMMYAVDKINGAVLWANLNLLFWLSLIPFVTGWMGENHFSKWPVVLYGIVLIMNAIAYMILCLLLVREAGPASPLAVALGKDWKGKLSLVIYAAAIGLAFLNSWLGFGMYVIVAVIWFIPDRRIEKTLSSTTSAKEEP
jgi:uncharacterized membrane protein